MSDRLDPILDRIAAGRVPANVGLMQLLVEAGSAGEAEEALATRLAAAPGGPVWTAADLLANHPEAFRTIRAVMAEADHGGTASPEEWAAVFDRLAAVAPEAGVALYALGSPALLARATAEVVELVRAWGLIGRDRDILEIGCGIGRLTLALAGLARHATGFDVSDAMIAEARRRGAAVLNARFARTPGRDLAAVADASVDLVLAADVFPYLVAAGEGLAGRHVEEAARVLRPGGSLLILNYAYRDDPAGDDAEVAALFAASGLATERIGTSDLRLWDATTYLARKPAGIVSA